MRLTVARRMLALLVLVAATMACDRVTKHIAATTMAGEPPRSFLAGTVRLEYVENTGAFLSLGADWTPAIRIAVFTIGTGLILVAAVIAALRYRWTGRPLIGVGLIVAGGASNLVDRLARGFTVDFMNVGLGPLRTGIFNVADVAITVGVVLLMFSYRHADVHSG